jgi:hypothetical protein
MLPDSVTAAGLWVAEPRVNGVSASNDSWQETVGRTHVGHIRRRRRRGCRPARVRDWLRPSGGPSRRPSGRSELRRATHAARPVFPHECGARRRRGRPADASGRSELRRATHAARLVFPHECGAWRRRGRPAGRCLRAERAPSSDARSEAGRSPSRRRGYSGERWCPGRDLNPDELPHTPLKRTRIPIPPPGHQVRCRLSPWIPRKRG